jgi:hypothetical protein
MYIFDVHVDERMIRVCVSVSVYSAYLYVQSCHQPATIVLTALLFKYVRLRNHHLFTHAKWLLLLMVWCCNGKSFELLLFLLLLFVFCCGAATQRGS